MQDAHSYLAESETLIRNFGLPKQIKSQKVSKLHHIFSFLRIIEESTSLKRSETNSDANERANNLVVLENPSNPETALILGMPTTPPANSRLNWVLDDEPDDPEEDPLFVSIYQMPTSLLSLLSQTSSLWKQLNIPSHPHHNFGASAKSWRIASSDGKHRKSSQSQIFATQLIAGRIRWCSRILP
jgi:arginine metabolism regulation protein II